MTLNQVLDRIRGDIEHCYFALCFEMESGLPLGIATTEFAADSDHIAAAFGQVMGIVTDGQKHGRNDTIRAQLNEFRELILETDISTFFVRVPANNNRIAIAIGVPKDTKIGFARAAMDRHDQNLIASIRGVI